MINKTTVYRGRFAPSPTGPLHKGSLVAAVASYLQAKQQQGQWLVRMEDVDELRNVKGAADDILRSLEAYGFAWDEDVLYQTQRKQAYTDVLQTLKQQQRVYPCTCSRKHLKALAASGEISSGELGYIYPGSCANNNFANRKETDYAIRIRIPHENSSHENLSHEKSSKENSSQKVPSSSITFTDELAGHYTQNLQKDSGDFIIRRRDGLFAYQLAVVVDDAFQNITHIVRGLDLLNSTPRQIFLQQCLDYPQINYAHLPLMRSKNGDKLSKQTGAQSIGTQANIPLLVECLELLGQMPPAELSRDSLSNVWLWARENWDMTKVTI